ncbi:MAG: DUF983 domain-containing protein [Dokdonia sp.]|jgi:uncharacterized protein (DUF983 family)|tara:strand:- start:119 stop:586 length:468 start_codon:yes stop_codon:yes gene_type:complete
MLRRAPIQGFNFTAKDHNMLEGTKLKSILTLSCPRCHKGDFFEGHPYKMTTMGTLKKRCAHCHQKFEIETGFYQGSYYVSYGLGVGLFVAVVILNFIGRDTVTPASLMISFLIALFFLMPLVYALSKIIWANFFITYDERFNNRQLISSNNDSRT